MADRNRYGRREYGEESQRSFRRDRQPEQFQSDRNYYGNDYESGYDQMGDNSSFGQSQYGGQDDNSSYRQRGWDNDRYGSDRSGSGAGSGSDRYGSSWRQDEGNRNRSYESDASGGFGPASFSNRERGGFGSFNNESFRTAGSVGPRENLGYGRGDAYTGGGYSGGSYGAGTYGAAPRREYGCGGYAGGGGRSSSGSGDRGFFERAGDEVASWFGDEDAARRREMDHRGRGPANYKRSDERLLEDACDRLTEDWGVDASNIQVTVQNGEVTLDGTVESRSQKRRAEDCVHDISGVKHVQNNLRITENRGSLTDNNRSDQTDWSSSTDRNSGTLA